MTARQKTAVWLGAAISIGIVVIGLLSIIRHPPPVASPVALTGVVLVDDTDPQKQAPITLAEIVASASAPDTRTKTDSSGLFHLAVPASRNPAPPLTLTLTAKGYEQRQVEVLHPDHLLVLRLRPLPTAAVVPVAFPTSVLANMLVRYSEKASVTTNAGSVVKTFEVVNKGNVPCKLKLPCSPDGKWKATVGSTTVEGQGSEFSNVRVSCIAGPCPFTSKGSINNGTDLQVSARNWSDTATFLVEAEVSQTRIIDVVRESFPAKFGSSLTFTLPATAQGPTIEADMNGQNIVYPLGPALIVSWANCSMKMGADQSKLYRCDLKPGYRFK